MTRALFVATVPEHLRDFHLGYVKHFRAKGWIVDGMASGISKCPKCTEHFDRVWHIDWSRNPLNTKNILVAPQVVREVVKVGEYDIVHVHTPVAAFVTRFALRNLDRSVRPKIIYTAHGFHFYRGGNPILNWIFLSLEKLAGRWMDHLVVMNKEDFNAATTNRITCPGRVTHMPGIGVDTSLYNRSSVSESEISSIREELQLSSDDELILMVAEFISRKRHEDALRAFAQCNIPNARLAFAGVGRLREQIKDLAKQLNVSGRVHFLGFRQDIPVLIKASTVVILPSVHEGLPRCIMEALCLGVPCIGSDIRGTRDLLEGGKGLLVEVGDIEGLSSAMVWIFENPNEARAMAARGKVGMAEYDFSNIVRLHEELYTQALAS